MPIITATVRATPRNDIGQFVATRVTPAVRAGVMAYANAVLQEAQAIVPVRTGALRDSGKVEETTSGPQVRAEVVFTAEHAGFVEFGTGAAGAASAGAGPYSYTMSWPGMAARPFLRNSLDTTRETGFALFRGAVSSGMKY